MRKKAKMMDAVSPTHTEQQIQRLQVKTKMRAGHEMHGYCTFPDGAEEITYTYYDYENCMDQGGTFELFFSRDGLY